MHMQPKRDKLNRYGRAYVSDARSPAPAFAACWMPPALFPVQATFPDNEYKSAGGRDAGHRPTLRLVAWPFQVWRQLRPYRLLQPAYGSPHPRVAMGCDTSRLRW